MPEILVQDGTIHYKETMRRSANSSLNFDKEYNLSL